MTPENRTIRIDDELWKAAQAAADREGKTMTEVIRAALTRYVKRSKTDPDWAPRTEDERKPPGPALGGIPDLTEEEADAYWRAIGD